MKPEVAKAVDELRRQFPESTVTTTDDPSGNVHVVIDPVDLGERFSPRSTWMGFTIPAQYPYADIYPTFIGPEVRRADGVPFTAPVNPGQHFQGRPAIMISRRSGAAMTTGLQTAVAKVLKILDFLQRLP